ncbi:MAG: tetratricopeptide repeat protein, partial [Myxococcota bacterium]|nr:tetratricopeptide repeat protein [Myxococcota bacterium]
MGAALILLLVGLGAMAAGVLIGRYYVPDDRQLRRTARHSRSYMRALSHLIARDHDTVISELRMVVEENVDDVEPYFALGALFRSRGEHERAIRVHQALSVRERDKRKLRQRAMFELGLDFRAAGMPRRATGAMEKVLQEEPAHEGALRSLAALYEEQGRFNEAAEHWQRLGKRRKEDTSVREHHLLVAAAQSALARGDADSAKQLLKAAQRHVETAHFFSAAAELAAHRGNHRGAKERLKQALLADPSLAPHLLPGLIAAEQGLASTQKPSARDLPRADELDDEAQASADKQLGTGDPASTALVAATEAPALTNLDTPPAGVPLVPATRPVGTVNERVLADLAEIDAQAGPRLEIALIRAQLAPPGDPNAKAELANALVTRFPDALAARVATARLALADGDAAKLRAALEVLVGEHGALAWALRGRWQCTHCSHRPPAFSWRCGGCRRWSSLRMETGIEPPPTPSRERRAATRASRPDGLL